MLATPLQKLSRGSWPLVSSQSGRIWIISIKSSANVRGTVCVWRVIKIQGLMNSDTTIIGNEHLAGWNVAVWMGFQLLVAAH